MISRVQAARPKATCSNRSATSTSSGTSASRTLSSTSSAWSQIPCLQFVDCMQDVALAADPVTTYVAGLPLFELAARKDYRRNIFNYNNLRNAHDSPTRQI